MSAITDGAYAVAADLDGEYADIVQFLKDGLLVCAVPSRPGFSYQWCRGSDDTALAVIQLEGTSDREIVWPYHSRVIAGNWDAEKYYGG